MNVIFENDSPKGTFWANKKKVEFLLLSSDSLKLLTTSLKSILAKFVLFEYNHVVIVIESSYRESDFYDLGWERLGLTKLMSQYDIIMYTVSMLSEISSLNLYLSC